MAYEEIDLLSYRARKTRTTWLDVNTRIGLNGRPRLVADIYAINNSIYNLFSCPIGERGRIFQPTYGTFLQHLLHEPMDDITATRVRASLIQSLEKWEPRVRINQRDTYVVPDTERAGYVVRVSYYYILSNETHAVAFFAPIG